MNNNNNNPLVEYPPKLTFLPVGSIQHLVEYNSPSLDTQIEYIEKNYSKNYCDNVVLAYEVTNSGKSCDAYFLSQLHSKFKSIGLNVIGLRSYHYFPHFSTTQSQINNWFKETFIPDSKIDIDLCKSLGIQHYLFCNEQPIFTSDENYHVYFTEIINYAHENNIKIIATSSYHESFSVTFQDETDYIGMNFYPPLSNKGENANLGECMKYLIYQNYNSIFYKLTEKYKKQIWITEIGCTTQQYALKKPSNRDIAIVGEYGYNIVPYIFWTTVLQYIGLSYNAEKAFSNIKYLTIFQNNPKYDVWNPFNSMYAKEIIKQFFIEASKTLYNSNIYEANISIDMSTPNPYIINDNYAIEPCIINEESIFIKSIPNEALLIGSSITDANGIHGSSNISLVQKSLNIANYHSIVLQLLTNDKYGLIKSVGDILIFNTKKLMYHDSGIFSIENLTIGTEYTIGFTYSIITKHTLEDNIGIALLDASNKDISISRGASNEVSLTFLSSNKTHSFRIYGTCGKSDDLKSFIITHIYCFPTSHKFETNFDPKAQHFSFSSATLNDMLYDYDIIDLINNKKYIRSQKVALSPLQNWILDKKNNDYTIYHSSLGGLPLPAGNTSGSSRQYCAFSNMLEYSNTLENSNQFHLYIYGTDVVVYISLDSNITDPNQYFTQHKCEILYLINSSQVIENIISPNLLFNKNTNLIISTPNVMPKFFIRA